MVKRSREVVWSKEAINELSEINTYIKKQSPSGAQKVIKEILSHTRKLSRSWDGFMVDELKDDNDGTYRVMFVYHYRISFRIHKTQIYILRIRHTSMEPFIH